MENDIKMCGNEIEKNPFFLKKNNPLVIPIMAFKIESKEMYPIFVFAKCCWSVY